MRVLITGGAGFIGSALSHELSSSGHNVLITTRRQSVSKEILTWKPPALIPPDTISNIDAVINLAGESIASGRWTAAKKERILSSRINTTRALVESMKKIPLNPPLLKGDRGRLLEKGGGGDFKKPKVLISASAVGYYGPRGDENISEDSLSGTDFLAEVCKAWEAEALKAQELGVRVVITRFGTVLESDGGALPKMARPFRFFLGGPIGSGKQWFSWTHREDLIGIIKYVLENKAISGPINVTAPQPVTNKEFSSAIGRALGRPSWLPVPGFVLKIAFGELGSVLLTGQRVMPEKISKAGYQFKYPDVDRALRAIFCKRQ